MSYSVNDTIFQVTLDSGTTEADLSGLTGLVDSSGNSIVTTTGGDQGGDTGNQKLYTLHHPYVFSNSGNLTIRPDDEQLFIENTDQRDNYQDFRLEDGSTTVIDGEYAEVYGTYYSRATWLRINRESNDSYRDRKAVVYIRPLAALDWRGGVAMGGAAVYIAGGGSTDAPKNISNATWIGRNNNQFSLRSNTENYTATNFTIMYNRLVDNRNNISSFGYNAINGLLEGGSNQTFENYTGTVNLATWTRYRRTRTFLNTSFGMELPVGAFSNNALQQGGVIRISKSVNLNVVDVSRTSLTGVQVAVKTYDNGDRIDFINQPSATSGEKSRFTDQTAISDILGTTDFSGEFSFTKLLKEHTQRHNTTQFSYDIGGFTGDFTAGDDINVTSSNRTRVDGRFLYHDVAERIVYFERTRNILLDASTFDSMLNLSQTGEVTFNDVTLNQNLRNLEARFTDGGDDSNPVGDVLCLQYGKQLTTTQLNYGGLNQLETTIFMLDDPFITEYNPNVVSTYNELGDVNKAYDYTQYYFEQNWQQEEELICNFSSGFLDFGSNSIVLDGTQLEPLSKSGTTYTLGVGTERFVGNIKASSVTLVNGARSAGIIDSGGVITLPSRALTLTGLQPNTEIRVFQAGTTTEIAGIENSGTTFLDDTIAVNSVDIVVHHVEYEHIRISGADTSSNLTLPIQQRFDRGYNNA